MTKYSEAQLARRHIARRRATRTCRHCSKALRAPVKHDLFGLLYPHRHNRLIWCNPDSDEIHMTVGKPR